MNALSPRDQKILVILGAVVLFGIIALWYPKAKDQWTTAQKVLRNTERRYRDQQAMIARRPELQARYDELKDKMPIFPAGKSVDTHWLPIMDDTARTNDVNIVTRSIGSEEQIGEVTELTLECRDWEARLDSLVHFMYDIETRQDAMMDLRQLYIKPSTKKPGMLQGTFTLNCAYMREE